MLRVMAVVSLQAGESPWPAPGSDIFKTEITGLTIPLLLKTLNNSPTSYEVHTI